MNSSSEIEKYAVVISQMGLARNSDDLLYSLKHFFKGLEFTNKRVLDIGSGSGLLSFYMACMGAEKVVCLEPIAEGSRSDIIKIFNKIKRQLNKHNIELHQVRFQDYHPLEKYDIILLNNSINHLEESACINLLKDQDARDTYLSLFAKLYSIANNNAALIICDCSNSNFFNTIKIKNPFAPTIEWYKHQSVITWTNLLEKTGFTSPSVKWTAPNRLRSIGRLVLANKMAAYFINSHFCLRMIKSA